MAFLGNINFACENPVELSEFWQAALGYVRPTFPAELEEKIQEQIDAGELDPTGWAMLMPPDGIGPRLLFQRREKTPTESIPIHLDLGSDDAEAEIPRLVELGATIVETKSHTIAGFTESWTVLRDPEGNGFCVNHGRADR
ncbi:MAG TPA: VOC family protein [Gaiellaceae bacterium]|nr:VOC family protein [Gaiellaceae bacterium]